MVGPEDRAAAYAAWYRDRLKQLARDLLDGAINGAGVRDADEAVRLGAKEAHRLLNDAINEIRQARKKARRRPPEPDLNTMVFAADIQQRTGCSKTEAVCRAWGKPSDANDDPDVRRILDKTRNRTLAEVIKSLGIALEHVSKVSWPEQVYKYPLG